MGIAFFWAFRYHLGSIAFGSLIIAIVTFIRFLFEWFRRVCARLSGENPCVKCILCCVSYCIWILERCVKYISKNAYIQVALTNDYFCKAAWNAFSLIIANAARFGWANSVGSILNFFGIVSIGASNGFLAFYVLSFPEVKAYYGVQSPMGPVVLIVIITLLIAQTFLSIFGFSSDAISQSFLFDESLGFKGGSRPEHMDEFAKEFEK